MKTAQDVFPQTSELYFPVSKLTLAHAVESVNWAQRHALNTVEDWKILVRGDTGAQLAIVGKDYKVLENKELYQHIEEALFEHLVSTLDDQGVFVVDRQSYGGRFCSREYRFMGRTVKVNGRDVCLSVTVCNGFGGSSVRLIAGAYEFYCTNGMMIGAGDIRIIRHTSGLTLDKISEWIIKTLASFDKMGHMWQEWSRKKLDTEAVSTFLDERADISDRLNEELFGRWSQEGRNRGYTVWALYSALTDWASHARVRTTGSDHTAKTIIERHKRVAQWVASDEWRKEVLGLTQ